jgi:hypothetical protein
LAHAAAVESRAADARIDRSVPGWRSSSRRWRARHDTSAHGGHASASRRTEDDREAVDRTTQDNTRARGRKAWRCPEVDDASQGNGAALDGEARDADGEARDAKELESQEALVVALRGCEGGHAERRALSASC